MTCIESKHKHMSRISECQGRYDKINPSLCEHAQRIPVCRVSLAGDIFALFAGCTPSSLASRSAGTIPRRKSLDVRAGYQQTQVSLRTQPVRLGALRWAQTAELQARPDTVALYGRFLVYTHGITLRIRELPRGDLCSLPSTAGNCRRTVFDSDDASTCSPDANVTSNVTSRFGPRLAKVSTAQGKDR